MAGFSYLAGVAKNRRAKCQGCKQNFEKGDARVGVKTVVDASSSKSIFPDTKWFHNNMKCLSTFRKAARWWTENGPKFSSVKGLEDLPEAEKKVLEKLCDRLSAGVLELSSEEGSESSSDSSSGDGSGDTEGSETSAGGGAARKRGGRSASSGSRSNSQSSTASASKTTGSNSEDSSGGSASSPERRTSKHQSSRQRVKGAKGNSSSSTRKRKRSVSSESSRASDEDEDDGDDGSSEEESKRGKSRTTKSKGARKGSHSPKKARKEDGDEEYYSAHLSSQENAEINKKIQSFSSKTVAQLKAMLKKNDQVQKGLKNELVERVAECAVLGGFPVCPQCGEGKLRWNKSSGVYDCPGFFDESSTRHVRCKFSADKIERTEWK